MPLHRTLLRVVHRFCGDRFFTPSFFRSSLGQRLFRFTSRDGVACVDCVDGLEVEYVYNTSVGKSLFFRHSFENHEIATIAARSLASKKRVVLDVGANIGWHSIKWAKVAADVRIYAFEPAPDVGRILLRNLQRNGVEAQVTIEPSAVSDRVTSATFYECEDNAFSSLKDTGRVSVKNQITVPVTTVDTFVTEKNLSGIALIKVDVEGFESEVLHGAQRTMAQQRPDLFVEIYGGSNSNPNPENTIRLAQQLGYRVFVFKGQTLVPYQRHADEFYNYYFTCQ